MIAHPVAGEDAHEFKRRLDRIPTSFRLGEGDARLLDRAVERVIRPDNPCLGAFIRLTQASLGQATAGDIAAARSTCRGAESGRFIEAP